MSSLTSPLANTEPGIVQPVAEPAPRLIIRIDVTPISADYANIQTIPDLGSCMITPVYWFWGESLTQADAVILMNSLGGFSDRNRPVDFIHRYRSSS